MSRKTKTKGKVPSLTELILSQTGKYDHLLTNPDGVRKYFNRDKKCAAIRFIGDEHFIEYSVSQERDERDECGMKGHKIFNTITDNGRVDMFLYKIDELGPVYGPSCTESIHWYVGIDGLEVRCFSIKVKDCYDIVGGTYYGEPKQELFDAESFKSVLSEYPYLITRLDLENNLDNILLLV